MNVNNNVSAGQPVIITGMHRSNTSLVAKAFHLAGMFMGDNLMPAGRHNREGYYEDRDIIAFHDRLLKAMGYDFWDITSFSDFSSREIPAAYYLKAAALIEEKFANGHTFGWKDPRTSLFLHFWIRVLPHARFVIVYRDPGKVVRSLVKRGDFSKGRPLKLWQAMRALRVCTAYSDALAGFAASFPSRCLIIKSPSDLLDSDATERINEVLLDEWQVDLPPIDFESVINRSLLTTQTYTWHHYLFMASRRARRSYQRLENCRIQVLAQYESPRFYP